MEIPPSFQVLRYRGWRKPEGGVIVRRPTFWGNWLMVGRPGKIWLGSNRIHPLPFPVTRENAVEWYEHWLREGRPIPAISICVPDGVLVLLAERHRQTVARLPTLRGKRLGCFCDLPRPGERDWCHRDVLARVALQCTEVVDG